MHHNNHEIIDDLNDQLSADLLFKVCTLLYENGKTGADKASNPSIVANKLATINAKICTDPTYSMDHRSGGKKT